MMATLTSKGQLTVPAALLKRFGWKAGQKFRIDENVPYLKAVPDFDREKMRSVIGCAKGKLGGTTMEWLNEMRGPDVDGKRRK
jgi:bifunctional DNA-binding transcriptional regulator/antitoxin component of YhaV-PrlF toxin-antitoxin module